MKFKIAILAIVMAVSRAWAASEIVDGVMWYYTVSANQASVISGAIKYAGDLVIPSVLGDCPVTSIGGYAFNGCSGLTSVTIPTSVTSIGSSAFSGCSGLTSVAIPSSVTSIGAYVLSGCNGLTSLTVPFVGAKRGNTGTSDSLFGYVFGTATYNGAIATKQYYSYSSYSTFYIPSSLVSVEITDETMIGYGAFYNCNGLTSVAIPSSATSIESYAFFNCSALTSLAIPSGVTSIGYRAFGGCSGLTSVTVPRSVTSIGSSAFFGCSGLAHVTLPFVGSKRGNSGTSESLFGYIFGGASYSGSVAVSQSYATSSYSIFYIPSSLVSVEITDETVIGYNAFDNCNGLKSVMMPSSVTSIDGCAFSGCSGLASVTIPDGVTYIGEYAFRNCSGLTSVTIPSSVASIGNNAFYGCSGLKSVTIPASVTSIGSFAFAYCSGLTSVTILKGVTSIGDYAFSGCSGLTSVTIPEGVTSIGASAFSGCSGLMSVMLPSGVTSIGNGAFSGCGGLANQDGLIIVEGVLYDYIGNSSSVTIPSRVTSIGASAFSGCSCLKSVSIPSSVTSIGASAFSGCSGLMSVTIHEGVTSIGNDVFRNCSGLTSVTIPSSVASIGYYVFSGCSGLTSLTVPFVGAKRGNTGTSDSLFGYIFGTSSYNEAIATKQYYSSSSYSTFYIPSSLVSVEITDETMIGYGAFYNCSGLKSVTIHNSVTQIGERAFYNCGGLTSVTIPLSVASVGSYAFSGCNNICSVTVPGWKCGINFSTVTNLVIAEGVEGIAPSSFSGCSSVKSLTIPCSVTHIGEYAFSNCSGLSLIMMPSSVTSIGDYAFRGCSGLASVTIPASVTNIGYRAFEGCSGLSRVVISEGVTNVGAYAFYNCSGLTSVSIPPSMTSIGDHAFFGCGMLARVDIFDLAKWCDITFSDNPLMYAGHLFLNGEEITELVIPEGVVCIGDCAFYGCSGLMSVTIPESVTSVGEWAFYNCDGLTSVTIPSSVTSIGDHAFSDCDGLTSVTVPASVTSIGTYAFYGCGNISSATLPGIYCGILSFPSGANLIIADGVTSIGNRAFSGCSGLKSVTIPSSVTSIGDDAFRNCSGLLSVAIPEGVTNIGEDAFYGCSGLTSVTIPRSVTSIGTYAFYGCGNISSATVPGWKCGIDFSSVTNLVIAESVENIVPGAFSGCSQLTSVMIPGSVTHIGEYSFRDCGGLTSIAMPSSVTSIGDYAFEGCSGLTSVTVPKSVTHIGRGAFRCSNLTNIVLPFVGSRRGNSGTDESVFCYVFGGAGKDDGMTDVSQMFRSGSWSMLTIPSSLRTVEITDETVVGCGAFSDCGGLMSVTLSSTVMRIDGCAFMDCGGLSSVTIPSSVTSIGDSAFLGCSGLTSVTMPTSVTSVGSDAFKGCNAITEATVPGWKCEINFDSVTNLIVTKGAICIRESAFSSCKNLIAVEIPEGITSIGSSAFEGCERLTSVKLPSSLENIGRLAFRGCDKLTEITLQEDAWKVGQGIGYPDWSFKCVGDTEWGLDNVVFHSAPHSVRSGNPGVAEAYGRRATTISTILCGKGDGSFWWKVDCEPKADDIDEYYDYAAFSIDGVEIGKIAGKKDWERIEYLIPDSGIHMLSWTFTRDDYDEDEALYENTAWLDDILFCEGSVEVSFSANGAEGDLPEKIVGLPGEHITLPMPDKLKKGTMMFVGWSDGDSVYKPNTEYTMPMNDSLLVAVWTEYWTIDRVLNVENVTFTTGGESNWRSDFAMSHDGVVSLRSGVISDSQSTWVQGSFIGKGEFSFWAKSSGEFYRGKMCDLLVVTLDGVEVFRDATNDWTKIVVPVMNDGNHTIRWTYSKNETRSSNDDCVWVDEVCWALSTDTSAAVPTVAELADVFGAESDVVKGIKDETQLAAFNQFLKDCVVTSVSDMSESQKVWAYQSFKLSVVMTTPQLFEEEPILKFDDVELNDGNLALTVSLHAGEEAVALAKDKLAEKIRVGTALDAIDGTPQIISSPSADGTSLTFTVVPPQGDKGFVRIRID